MVAFQLNEIFMVYNDVFFIRKLSPKKIQVKILIKLILINQYQFDKHFQKHP